MGIATLHLALTALTVAATGIAAGQLSGNHRLWILGPAIVAVDPLLTLYSRQPMTETLCACLSAVLVWRVTCRDQSVATWRSASGEGIAWGLCLLARPTYWAAMAIWLLVESCRSVRKEVHHGDTEARSNTGHSGNASSSLLPLGEGPLFHLILVTAVALLTMSPWAFRNWQAFGRPIVTTTHGGYTLWLANNPVYYRDVVEAGASAWDSASLARWQTETDQNLDRRQIVGEVDRDRALSQQARAFIQANPVRFMQACLFRAQTFWGITPSRTAGDGQNLPMLWGVGGFYLALWVGGIASLIRLFRRRSLPASAGFSTTFCLILGFFIVHLVYWTDVRMRAPIIPAVAIFVAAAWGSTGRSSKPTD